MTHLPGVRTALVPRRRQRPGLGSRSFVRVEALESRLVLSQLVGTGTDSASLQETLGHCRGAGHTHGPQFDEACELAPVETAAGAEAEIEFGPIAEAAGAAEAAMAGTPVGDAAGSDVFALHSRPGATKRIYLDFDGHTTTNTNWNWQYTAGAPISSPAFDLDGNPSSFSSDERNRIRAIWERVAEDYSPFDVDVTTQDPGFEALRKSSPTDTEWGIRVVIGGSSLTWYKSAAGGVAYVNSFTLNSDTPAFIFPAQLAGGSEKYMAEAITHEVGHTLGLSHDGRKSPSEAYYSGHGSGDIAWAPIMGLGYYNNLTQWSKGEYASANNPQDDLTIITTRNGFGYRPDDHGSTIDTATAATLSLDARTITAGGIIERSNDYDVFSFSTETGLVSLSARPAARGPNLDILLEVLNSSQQVIAAANPSASLAASITNLALASGVYYARISGIGAGLATGTGYTEYASLGQYTLSGTVVAPPSDGLTLRAVDASQEEAHDGFSTPFTFVVDRTGPLTGTTVATYAIVPISTTAADFGGTLPAPGTLVFEPGQRTATITVWVSGDRLVEPDETFEVRLTGVTGDTRLLSATALGTIRNDDVASVAVSASSYTTSEARGPASTARLSLVLTAPPLAPVTIPLRSTDTTEGRLAVRSVVFTPANWNVPQTVAVTGVDDAARDGDTAYRIELGSLVSDDPAYQNLDPDDITLVNQDNERPLPAAQVRRLSLQRARARGMLLRTTPTITAADDGPNMVTGPAWWPSALARRQALLRAARRSTAG